MGVVSKVSDSQEGPEDVFSWMPTSVNCCATPVSGLIRRHSSLSWPALIANSHQLSSILMINSYRHLLPKFPTQAAYPLDDRAMRIMAVFYKVDMTVED